MVRRRQLLCNLGHTLAVARMLLNPAFGQDPLTPNATSMSVRDHGAAGDGVADDSQAFAAACAMAARSPTSRIHVPAGTYRMARRVVVDLQGDRSGGLAITGDGQGATVIVVDNPDGGIAIRNPLCGTQVSITGLTFLAGIDAAGVAVEVSSRRTGARNFRSLTIRDVDIRSAPTMPGGHFTIGLQATNQWRPLFDNVIACGIVDPAVNRDRTDDSPLFRTDCCFAADGCYAPTFEHCYAWSAKTGYRIVSEGPQDGPEDGAFRRCTANMVRVGIDIRTPTIEPQLVIDACHVNARDVGIRLEKRKFFHLVNNLMYGLDHVDDAPYVDIDLIGCHAGLVSGNIFQSPAPHNLKAEPVVDHTMIRIDATSHDIVVADNIFNAKGTSVVVAPEAKSIEIRGSQFSNRHALPDSPRSR